MYNKPLLRIAIIGLTVVLVALNEIATYWSPVSLGSLWITFGSLLIAAVGILTYIWVDRSQHWRNERTLLNQQVNALETMLETSNKRQQAVFQISRLFASAQDEADVIDLILTLSREVIGARGASFVPLDERSQPLQAKSVGEMPLPQADAWLEYLASPKIRQRCGSCQNSELLTNSCPLLIGSFQVGIGIYCVPLRRGKQEYGVLNLYLPEIETLNVETQDFLRKIIDETSTALEGMRLRNRELNALRQMQTMRERTDIASTVNEFLRNLHETIELDFSLVTLPGSKDEAGYAHIDCGEIPASVAPLVDSLINAVLKSNEPVLLGDVGVELKSSKGGQAIMGLPLATANNPAVGALIVGRHGTRSFTPQQRSIIQTLAGQLALILHNANLIAELEYKTIVEERTRLAREIHDGLAQTLGFLKLKSAQMKNFMDYGEYDQLRETIPVCYEAISEAYQDARQAIDGLRISNTVGGIAGWLQQTVEEFEENTDIAVHLDIAADNIDLPPEVHAQLMRIVQEALNNVRKHARAEQAWVTCCLTEADLIFEIRDDGRGFEVGDVTGLSQYGLQGMRERTALIGGEFQVIGRPEQGTIVRVRLPLTLGEGML